MTYKKKLIEVALPLEAINRESARESYIYKGNPSAVHKWWAQRPLAACRAIVFASLVDDPSAHPDRFPTDEAQQAERQRLFRLIEALVTWENGANEVVLQAARTEILNSTNDDPPPVMDPFCGGGSIPLEAQRLGLETHASDLNPLAVLITKALIEIPAKSVGCPPTHPDDGTFRALRTWKSSQGLAEDVRYYGKWMRDEAERRIGHLYPKVKLSDDQGEGEATAIAWIWARTVKSPNPAWDGDMPLVRSFTLSAKKGKETWAQPIVDRENRCIRFEIRTGPGCPEGTVRRTGAVCLATGTPVPLSYVRAEGKAGRMGAQLMAIVAEGRRGRFYVAPDEHHECAASRAVPPSDLPDTEIPYNPRYLTTPNYGMTKHRDLFTDRQLTALGTFSDLVTEALTLVTADSADECYGASVATYLAFVVDKMAEYGCTLVPWYAKEDRPKGLFARQAIPMLWDFCEVNPLGSIGGTFEGSLRVVTDAFEGLMGSALARTSQLDATAIAPASPVVFITDPPYYDNIGYADLSDFFYVWLRRSLKAVYPDLFSTLLVPKQQELVADPFRHGGDRQSAERHFETGLGVVFERMRAYQAPNFPMTIVYAFKQAEQSEQTVASTGWETMLEALVRAQLSIHGTWPLRSERGGRMRDIGSNALASSVALICRPRSPAAPLATRKEFLMALKRELPEALRCLQQGNIAPVDLAQAAIGPGMGVFSRYSKVVEADGRPMTVRTALGLINQVLDETLAEQESDFDADTRWALAWFEQFGMLPGPFGVAESLSKAKNTGVNALVVAGFLESKGGKVRLLDREELASTWDPATDKRLTVWEVTQHLMRVLESDGEAVAGELLRRVGGLGETARELAYRLYVLCERKKWAKEALAYNGLVVAWPEIARLAAGEPVSGLIQDTLL